VVSKRPCRICRRWFLPNPRAGPRQRTCGSPDCQRERHRRNCSSWHQRNPDYDRETRLRIRLAADRPKSPDADLLSWPSARDVVGLEVLLVLEETRRLLVDPARDAVGRQVFAVKRKSGEVAPIARETPSTHGLEPP
jgi:hypothetical protein